MRVKLGEISHIVPHYFTISTLQLFSYRTSRGNLKGWWTKAEQFPMPPRRWNSLGHVLRREGENDCFTTLGWTPGKAKGEREIKDHLEKDCWEGEKQNRMEELEFSRGGGTEFEERVLVRERDSLMGLLARREWMVMPLRAAIYIDIWFKRWDTNWKMIEPLKMAKYVY